VCVKHYMNVAIKQAKSPVWVGGWLSVCLPGQRTFHTALGDSSESTVLHCVKNVPRSAVADPSNRVNII